MMKSGKKTTIIISFLSILFFCPISWISHAQQEQGLEEILQGFDEEGEKAQKSVPEKKYLPDFLNLDGYLKLGLSYSPYHHKAQGTDTDWHGLSRLQAKTVLEMDTRFSDTLQGRVAGHGFCDVAYTLQGRDKFTQAVLNANEHEFEFDEIWLQGSPAKNIDLKIGRQIVVWGKSDNIRITDVLNPLDLREPGLTDIEDLRLPITMTKLDYFVHRLNLSGIIVHEIRYDKNPAFGSDFFPAPRPLPTNESPDEGFAIDHNEFALAINGIFHGWDASMFGAYLYDDTPHFAIDSPGPPPRLKLKHARIKMAGVAFNIATGNWLFKTEGAYFNGIRFFNSNENFNRIDSLVGIEYSGFTDTVISFEIADRHLINFDNSIKEDPDSAEEDRWISALRMTTTYFNETVTLTALALTFGLTGEDGALQRVSVEYDLTDAIEISGGALFYSSGDLKSFQAVGDNDRLYLEIKYSF